MGRSPLIQDRESVLWLKLVLGFVGVLSVDRRSRGGGSRMIFRIGAFRMRLSFDVEDWEFIFEECSLRMSSNDGWLDIAFTVVVFV